MAGSVPHRNTTYDNSGKSEDDPAQRKEICFSKGLCNYLNCFFFYVWIHKQNKNKHKSLYAREQCKSAAAVAAGTAWKSEILASETGEISYAKELQSM